MSWRALRATATGIATHRCAKRPCSRGSPRPLATLSEHHRLAVATSKPFAFAEPLLTVLDLRSTFEHLAAPDLEAHREDKQATIHSALSVLNATRAVMVGDRSFDIHGAHACGIPAIGVSWGIGSTQELAGAGADIIVEAPADLPRAVGQLLS